MLSWTCRFGHVPKSRHPSSASCSLAYTSNTPMSCVICKISSTFGGRRHSASRPPQSAVAE
ncbi:hypothetical protein [Nannocystis pusilla]|uniref:hypothetical protein n=1 Tax=Nannocystis pusilla TaxID=889268 RepID=UPI003B82BFB7